MERIAKNSSWTRSLNPTMTLKSWTFLLFVTSVLASSSPFENTAIVRTADLGGSVVHVTTTFSIKALENGQQTYTIALSRDEMAKTSWIESKLKGNRNPLTIKERVADPHEYVPIEIQYRTLVLNLLSSEYHLVDIVLPRALDANKTMSIVLETMQTHATWPCPATAAQTEAQAQKYKTDLFVLSPYPTLVQRTKLK